MPDFSKPRHTAKVLAESSDQMGDFRKYLSKPFTVDDEGNIAGLVDPQPSAEESAELMVRAEQHYADAEFWRTIAPDLPRDGS